MLSPEAKTPDRLPFISSECPTHTPTSSPVGRKRPPPDRPCWGIFSVIKNDRAAAVVEFEPHRFQQPRIPVCELAPQVKPDRDDGGVARRFFGFMVEPSDIGQCDHFPDADDRHVGGCVGGHEAGAARLAARPLVSPGCRSMPRL